MKFRSPTPIFYLVLFWFGLVPDSLAQPPDYGDQSSRDFARATRLREQANHRASANLGYDPVYLEQVDRNRDTYALTLQISQLAQIIRNLADSYAVEQSRNIPLAPDDQGVPYPMTIDVGGFNISSIYGPGGLTVEAVSIVLDYQLLRGGNTNLKRGEVKDLGDFVIAQVVTTAGGLVRRYEIDKATGLWRVVGQ